MNSPKVSLLCCVYNGRDLLSETISRINQLELIDNTTLELVVVDNNSTDESVELICSLFKKDERHSLKILTEKRQGAGWATRTGLLACEGDYIGVVDQDNWVHPDWLLAGCFALDNNPKLGGIGSLNHAVFETEKPDWFDRYQANYAVGPQLVVEKHQKIRPVIWSAGCFLRNKAVKQALALDIEPVMLSRSGKELLAGDDTETFMLMQLCGWDFDYDSRIQIDHYMPKERLSWRYYLRLREGNGRTSVYIDMYRRIMSEIIIGNEAILYDWQYLKMQDRKALLSDIPGLVATLLPGFEGNNRPAVAMSKLGAFRERCEKGAKLLAIYNSLRARINAKRNSCKASEIDLRSK